MANEVQMSDVSDLIRSEDLARVVQTYRRGNTYSALIRNLVWTERASAATHVWPRLAGAIDPGAGTKVEFPGGTFANIQVSTAAATATPGVVGGALAFSRESTTMASGVARTALESLIDGIYERIFSDCCALSTGASESVGNSTTDFTMALLRTAVREWMLLRPDIQPVLVCHPDALYQLREDAGTAASSWIVNGERFSLFNGLQGYQGAIEGLPVICVDTVADNEGAHSNFMTGYSPKSGPHGISGLGLATWVPVFTEVMPQPDSFSDKLVAACMYGTVLTNNDANGQATLLEIQSQPES